MNKERRVWMIACGAAGGVTALGGGAALLQTLTPSESAKIKAQAVEVDVSTMQPGDAQLLAWQGKPVWVVRRSSEMLQALPALASQLADPLSLRHADLITPAYARNIYRSIKPEYLVVMGVCSHLGCSPLARLQAGPQARLPDDWKGGFLCPCHGSTFDAAGRVFVNKPAPDNLAVPPHRYLSETRILIGEAEPDASHS